MLYSQYMKKKTHSDGYILCYIPEHPGCMNGYVYEHRLILEKHLGRYLTGDETVHHINQIPDDNRIANLLLCSNNMEHRRYHQGWTKKDGRWFKRCNICNRILEVNNDNFHFRKKGRTGKVINPCRDCAKTVLMKLRRKYDRSPRNEKL